jgi:hypothetical protein
MIMAPENEAPSEDSLFDSAIEDVTPAPAEPKPAPAPAERPAPERTEAAPAGEGDKPAPEDDGPLVPSWRLKEITEERRVAQAERDQLRQERDHLARQQEDFQRRLAAMEKPAQAPDEPDPLLDPKGYREFMERRFEERLTAERRESSLQRARWNYKEEFDQAYEAAQKYVDPGLRARMQQSSDPGETLMGWFRELRIRAEVGNDPAAYRKKLRDEALKDPEFRKAAMEAWRDDASAVTNGRPNVQLAPSLNGISRSNAQLRASHQDLTDDALFEQSTTTRR